MGLVNFKGPFNFMDLFKLGAGWKDATESAKIDSESVRNMHVDLGLFLFFKDFVLFFCCWLYYPPRVYYRRTRVIKISTLEKDLLNESADVAFRFLLKHTA